MPILVNQNFSTIKTNLLRQLSKQNCLKPSAVQRIKDTTSHDEFILALEDIAIEFNMKNYAKPIINLENIKKHNSIPLEIEQYISKLQLQLDTITANLFKILTFKDTDEKVLKIKKILKEKYNIKNLYCNNSLDFAEKCLATANLMHKQNLPMPEEIIGSEFLLGEYRSPFSMKVWGKPSILINPDCLEEDWVASTDSPLHVLVHECAHNLQLNLISFHLKKIPERFNSTTKRLSLYADGNYAHEIHAELMAKKVLGKLSAKEEELLKYLST